jgi:hypothetical protein
MIMAKNHKLPKNSAPTRDNLLAWLKMRIEEINSSMTQGKSEACADFAIDYADRKNPVLGADMKKAPGKTQGLAVVSSSNRILQ